VQTRAFADPPPWPYGPDDQVRKVQAAGRVDFQGHPLRLPKALRGYAVAFRPTPTDGCWDVFYMTERLRTIDLRDSHDRP
jgi:hypothetical protein